MTRDTIRIALFGGALVAPGIIAAQAEADATFTPYASANPIAATAYAYDFDEGDDLFGGTMRGTSFLDYAITVPYATVRSAVQPTELTSTIDVSNWPSSLSDAYARAASFITLAELESDTELRLEWGGDEAASTFGNRITITEFFNDGVTPSVEVFNSSSIGPSGSLTFTLGANRLYQLSTAVTYIVGPDGNESFSRFATITIVPAPASAGLLTLGGVLLSRRRR